MAPQKTQNVTFPLREGYGSPSVPDYPNMPETPKPTSVVPPPPKK